MGRLVQPDSRGYELLDGLRSADEARQFFADSLPSVSPYLRDEELARFVERPISRLPSFQLVEGDVHASLPAGGVVLLGDSIKAVKPYFGQGANSALEDVAVLARCLDACGDDAPSAAAAFTRERAEEARALVRTSRSFDGRGALGTARFLVPLLLDIQLNRLLPSVFTPPILRGLQDERNSFTGLRVRKRRERTLQLSVLAGLVGAALVRPLLVAQVAYAGVGVGVGFGGTKFLKFVRSGEAAKALAASPIGRRAGAVGGSAQAKLRSLLLRIDPSLEKDAGAELGLKDIKAPPMPFRKKSQ